MGDRSRLGATIYVRAPFGPSSVADELTGVTVHPNPEADGDVRGDFRRWPAVIAFEPDTEDEDAVVAEVSRILLAAWRRGWGAVAECDDADRLPNGGGWDPDGPWQPGVPWAPFDTGLELDPWAHLFVRADEPLDEVRRVLEAAVEGTTVDVEVERNDDAGRGGDGDFLYWPYTAWYDAAPEVDPAVAVAEVSAMLRAAWDRGWGAVAACDYEDRLPNGGSWDPGGPWRPDRPWAPLAGA